MIIRWAQTRDDSAQLPRWERPLSSKILSDVLDPLARIHFLPMRKVTSAQGQPLNLWLLLDALIVVAGSPVACHCRHHAHHRSVIRCLQLPPFARTRNGHWARAHNVATAHRPSRTLLRLLRTCATVCCCFSWLGGAFCSGKSDDPQPALFSRSLQSQVPYITRARGRVSAGCLVLPVIGGECPSYSNRGASSALEV